jgi:hypothetical protein
MFSLYSDEIELCDRIDVEAFWHLEGWVPMDVHRPRLKLKNPPVRHFFLLEPGANVGMANGAIRLLPSGFPAEKLKAMLTIDGGEKISEEER